MSAFLVSKTHVAALVRWYGHPRRGGVRGFEFYGGSPEAAAAMLYAENVRSVNHRYQDDTPDEPVAFSHSEIARAPMLSAVEALKAVHCLRYQSCETDDYDTTPAAKLLREIESDAVRFVPGYDEAAWAIPHDAPAGPVNIMDIARGVKP